MTVSWILFVIAIPLFVVSLSMAAYQHWSIKSGKITDGTVVENVARSSSGSGKFSPKIGFKTRQGAEVHFMTSFSSNPPSYNVGDRVKVVYQGAGEDARILSFGLRFGLSWALMGGAIALLILSIGFRYGDRMINSLYGTTAAYYQK